MSSTAGAMKASARVGGSGALFMLLSIEVRALFCVAAAGCCSRSLLRAALYLEVQDSSSFQPGVPVDLASVSDLVFDADAFAPPPADRPHYKVWPKRLPRRLAVPNTSLWYSLEVSATRFPDK